VIHTGKIVLEYFPW